jgi:hypothetical protein
MNSVSPPSRYDKRNLALLTSSGVHFSEDEEKPNTIHVLIPRSKSMPWASIPELKGSKMQALMHCDESIDRGSLPYAQKLLSLAFERTQARLLSQDGVYMV